VVAEIRRTHPPVLASEPGFVLHAPGLFPEGMAFDPRTRRVYAGSASTRRLVWTDASAVLRVLVPPRGGGLGFPAGMKVDPRRDQLWVCSTASFGEGVVLSDAVNGLLAFDLRDGRRVRAVVQATGFLNDLVVVPSTGEVLATNTSTGAIARARPGATTTEELLPAGSVSGANGIALDDRERFLFVAGDEGITRVDLRTRAFQRLERPPEVVDGSFDGLYFHKGTLVGVQNGVHPGRVVRLRLDATLGRIVGWEVLEAYAPWIETPTTGALDGDSLLYLANTQLRRWKPSGSWPVEGLVDVQVRRVALGGR
jgi:sugar lactone lactonase YvrE